MYINGHDNKVDVIQNVIENIDDGLYANAKDMLNQLKEIANNETNLANIISKEDRTLDETLKAYDMVYNTEEESDVDISLNLEAEQQIGK